VELHPNLDAAADAWLVPDGPFARFLPDPPGSYGTAHDATRGAAIALERDATARRQLVARLGQVAPGDAASVRDALLWHGFVRLELFCRRGLARAAQTVLNDAWGLAPGDLMLRDIARSCRLHLPGNAP